MGAFVFILCSTLPVILLHFVCITCYNISFEYTHCNTIPKILCNTLKMKAYTLVASILLCVIAVAAGPTLDTDTLKLELFPSSDSHWLAVQPIDGGMPPLTQESLKKETSLSTFFLVP